MDLDPEVQSHPPSPSVQNSEIKYYPGRETAKYAETELVPEHMTAIWCSVGAGGSESVSAMEDSSVLNGVG